jgi:hypothetical protein
MILRMRKAESSTKLNCPQQARRISLKQNALKIGDFLEISTTALGAGGRAFKSPRPDQKNQVDADISSMPQILPVDRSVALAYLCNRLCSFSSERVSR